MDLAVQLVGYISPICAKYRIRSYSTWHQSHAVRSGESALMAVKTTDLTNIPLIIDLTLAFKIVSTVGATT